MTQPLPTVALVLPDRIVAQVLREEALARLGEVAQIVRVAPDAAGADLPALLRGASVAITGWGSPTLTPEVLDAVPELGLVAHTAGSIRRVVDVDAVQTRVRVTHAAAVIADSVAEFVIGQTIAGLRGIVTMDRRLRAGDAWQEVEPSVQGRLLRDCVVGVIGASQTGRAVIGLLRGFGARILVSDPTATPESAGALGAELVDLADLLASSDVVTLHAPVLPTTIGMIGAAELAQLPDGALLVNSARGVLVDDAALRAEVSSGRITAALDVFDPEPLPPGSPWLTTDGVVLTTHNAGHTVDGHLAQGDAMVAEIRRYLAGEPLQYEITAVMAQRMA